MKANEIMETKGVIDVLNDLIKLNRDRVEGYQKAREELEDGNRHIARTLIDDRIQESHVFINELTTAISGLDGFPEDTESTGGKLYRAWMGLKTSFTGGSSKSVLELCEYGEDVALKVYDAALKGKTDWPEDILSTLSRQRMILEDAHDIIKRNRDIERART